MCIWRLDKLRTFLLRGELLLRPLLHLAMVYNRIDRRRGRRPVWRIPFLQEAVFSQTFIMKYALV